MTWKPSHVVAELVLALLIVPSAFAADGGIDAGTDAGTPDAGQIASCEPSTSPVIYIMVTAPRAQRPKDSQVRLEGKTLARRGACFVVSPEKAVGARFQCSAPFYQGLTVRLPEPNDDYRRPDHPYPCEIEPRKEHLAWLDASGQPIAAAGLKLNDQLKYVKAVAAVWAKEGGDEKALAELATITGFRPAAIALNVDENANVSLTPFKVKLAQERELQEALEAFGKADLTAGPAEDARFRIWLRTNPRYKDVLRNQ